MHPHSLKRELSAHLIHQAKLRDAYPDLESDDLKDTLEGLTNLPEMLAALLRSHLDDSYTVKALKARIEDMRERLNELKCGPTKNEPWLPRSWPRQRSLSWRSPILRFPLQRGTSTWSSTTSRPFPQHIGNPNRQSSIGCSCWQS